ncbi:Extracellular serine-rich protein [Penicillium rolfsii]|nr:Extracellular serine-rich protein [Penicillium rolfsii]
MLFAQRVLRALLVSAAWASLAGAADTASDGSATPTAGSSSTTTTFVTSTTTSTGSVTHTVQVGPKSSPHAYVPHNLTANPGDVVVFEFYPTNHSVVKADFGAPCVPATGEIFYSGMFNSFNEKDGQLVGPPPTWSLVINDTKPTFFYCTAIGSCLENGMVGVINPNSTETFQAQYQKALTYPYMLVPGQSMPAEGGGSTASGDSTASTTTSATAGATTSSAPSGGGGGGLSGGAIAGIVIAAVAFVAILVALFFVLGRNRVYSQWMSSQDGRTERTARWALFNNTGGSVGGRKGELDSNTARAPGTDVPSVGSPDPTMSQFSPAPESVSGFGGSSPRQNSGQWNWDIPQNSRSPRGPSELEGNPMVHQLPERRGS